MNVLCLSDIEQGYIYHGSIAERFKDMDLVISCGDLPYYYLEFVVSMLNVPLYYVRGNHAHKVEHTSAGDRSEPWGCINLHRRSVRGPEGLLLAGVEGSLQYNYGPYQYTQPEMWMLVFSLVPGFFINKILYGRYLDIFISHAPPWKIHDKDDRPHQGIKAFRWLINVFRPSAHLHGHIHLYRQDEAVENTLGITKIINCYGHRELYVNPAIKPVELKRTK